MPRCDALELFGCLFWTVACCYTHCYIFYSLQYYMLEPLGEPSYSAQMTTPGDFSHSIPKAGSAW
jgi:hypothetical protein